MAYRSTAYPKCTPSRSAKPGHFWWPKFPMNCATVPTACMLSGGERVHGAIHPDNYYTDVCECEQKREDLLYRLVKRWRIYWYG